MNPRFYVGLESAEHKVATASEMLSAAKSDCQDSIIRLVDLDPTTDDVASLRAQVSLAILLVAQADKIVRTTEEIVSRARDAVQIVRKMHAIGEKDSRG